MPRFGLTYSQKQVHLCLRVFLGFIFKTLQSKYSFLTWHPIFAHEEFWIRKTVTVGLSGSVLFLTWLVYPPFLTVLMKTHIIP